MDGTLVLRSSNIQDRKIILDDNVYVQMPIPDELITRKGDILICSRNGSRDLIGKNAQIDEESVGCSFGAFTTLFRSEHNRYLYYLFNSPLFEYQSGRFLTATINQLTILKRAAAAKAGIYGNDAVEAMYPITRNDSNGQTLDGSKHNYTLTFPKGQQPPVNAFWSLTMYDGKTQLLIKNLINRYLVNSPMLSAMKTNTDGSLTLYIQNKSPGADKEANWLPAPNGPIYLVMRLYWPKETPPSILPPGDGTWKPPGIQLVE
jgi:hypothetical protein